MSFKLLLDECLSPELVDMAAARGHVESTCVRNMGWSGKKDWELIRIVVEGDYTLVTHNAVDFRGGGPGALGGEHARQETLASRRMREWALHPRWPSGRNAPIQCSIQLRTRSRKCRSIAAACSWPAWTFLWWPPA